MKEFSLNSAEKYKDGSPMMTDLPVQLVRLLKRIELLEKKVRDDDIGKYSASSLKEYIDDELSEEMQAVAKEHIKHEDRIEICEGNIEDLDYRLEEIERKLGNVLIALRYSDLTHLDIEPDNCHKGSDFCGNCTHCNRGKQGDDTVYVCELSHEIVDPDDSSCSMFEPPF